MGGAGEPAVGNQGHRVAQALADQRAGYRQHFPHAGTALGALVADDDDVALVNLAALDGLEGGFFLFEYPGGTLIDLFLVAGHLDDRAIGGQVAAQDGQAARGTAGIIGPVDYCLVVDGGHIGHVLGQGPAGNGHGVAVEQAGLQHSLGHQGNAAVAVQVGHNIAPAGAHVGNVGSAAADAVEVVQAQLNPRFVGDGHQVQDGVGGAAHGQHHGDGVFEGLASHNVPGPYILLQQAQKSASGLAGFIHLARVDGGNGCVAGQRHAHDFDGGGHGVGGKQAGAGTLAGAGHALQGGQFLAGDAALGVGAHCLEHVLDVHVVAQVLAGHDGAAVDEDGRHVEAGDGHHAARHVLVAAGDGNQAIHALPEGDHLDGVGDDLAAHQGCLHALGAHGDAVADGDGAKFEGGAVGLAYALLGGLGKAGQVDVAGGNVAGQVGYGDEGFVQVFLGQAHGEQHGPGRGPLGSLGNVIAAMLHPGDGGGVPGSGLGGVGNGSQKGASWRIFGGWKLATL